VAVDLGVEAEGRTDFTGIAHAGELSECSMERLTGIDSGR